MTRCLLHPRIPASLLRLRITPYPLRYACENFHKSSCTPFFRVIRSLGFLKLKSSNMKRIHLLTSLAAFAVFLPMSRAGDVSGTVTLKGTPPPEKDIAPLKDDPNCGKLHA